MALKWLGNEGSHSSKKSKVIERSQLLEALDILEYVLEAIFDSRSKKIAKAARTINKKKGL